MIKPVVYDELEFFKKSGDYPFSKRKNMLPSLFINATDKISKFHKVLLRKNEVCFNKNFLGELLFWKDEKCESSEDFEYKKLKF